MAVGLSQYVLVESKSLGAKSAADAVLRGLGLRPVQMSKYCVAVALLYPGVRSNPWHRTLRRYFADPVPGRSSTIAAGAPSAGPGPGPWQGERSDQFG